MIDQSQYSLVQCSVVIGDLHWQDLDWKPNVLDKKLLSVSQSHVRVYFMGCRNFKGHEIYFSHTLEYFSHVHSNLQFIQPEPTFRPTKYRPMSMQADARRLKIQCKKLFFRC